MTKNQHYIPRFYQRYWECETKGCLWSYDKRRGSIRQRPISANCSEDYLYEPDIDNPDNAMENKFGKFEKMYSDPYKSLMDRIACIRKLSEQDKKMICKLFANFSARHPKNLYNNSVNNRRASIYTLGIKDKNIDRRSINLLYASAVGGMSVVFDQENEILSPFEEKLLARRMQLLYTDEPKIVFCDALVKEVCYIAEWFFPLSPTMVAHFSWGNSIEDKTIRKMTEEEYRRFIFLYTRSGLVEKIFAQSKEVLEKNVCPFMGQIKGVY